MEAGELFGRDAELARLDDFIEQADASGAALMLAGEPGIGKTTLWREAIRRAQARGLTVLSCRPAEAEAKLSFTALADLLEPAPADAFEGLPAPQRHALDVALLRA